MNIHNNDNEKPSEVFECKTRKEKMTDRRASSSSCTVTCSYVFRETYVE